MSQRPDPLSPNWNAYFDERLQYLDAIFEPPVWPEDKWIVKGLLPRGYLTLLAGRPKDGKTCFATALAVAVAQGVPFAGMETTRSQVLYFCAEESVREWSMSIRPHLPEQVENFGVAFVQIAIDSPFYLEAIRLKVAQGEVGLIVVDPLIAASHQSDFTSSCRARNALEGLKILCKETDISVIVVHHAKERRGKAHCVAENPQLAAAASLNIVLNWRPHPKGRLVTLKATGRGLFSNQTHRFYSPAPCTFLPLQFPPPNPSEPNQNVQTQTASTRRINSPRVRRRSRT